MHRAPALLSLVLLLSACSAAVKMDSMDAKSPLPVGEGAFSIAIVSDSYVYDNDLPYVNTWGFRVAPGKASVADQPLYATTLYPIEGNSVLLGSGTLPPGTYHFVSLYLDQFYGTPYGNGHNITDFAVPRLEFEIQPGKDLDLGMLIRSIDPADKSLAGYRYGWRPSTPDVAAEIRSYAAKREPAPEVLTIAPRQPDGSALPPGFSGSLLANPAPERMLRVFDDGAIEVGAHLGRILYRDSQHQWHVWDTGQLGAIDKLQELKDGRTLVLADGETLLLSDPSHTHWQKIPAPSGLTITGLGVLGDGRITVSGRHDWFQDSGSAKGQLTRGEAVYASDPDAVDWKVLLQMPIYGGVVFDADHIYMFESGNGLWVMDVHTGSVRHGFTPGASFSAPGDSVLLSDIVDQDDSYKYSHAWLSDDAGVSWKRIDLDSYGDRFELKGSLMQKSPGVYQAQARMRPEGTSYGDAKAWTEGYYETSDLGQTWKLDFTTAVVPAICPVPDLLAVYASGKYWTVCEDDRIWSYDPNTHKTTLERDIAPPATAP